MKRTRLIAAGVLLTALIAMKAFLPDLTEALQQKARAAFPDETDYRAVFETLGAWIAPPEGGTDAYLAAEAVPLEPAVRAARRVEEAPAQGETAPEGAAEPEPQPTPDAMAVFLKSQADFADYALPANVDYAWPLLPFAFVAPVAGYTSSGFGYRQHPILDTVRFHYGTDVAADAGEPVRAFADGVVGMAGESADYGNYLVLDHGEGWTTLYAHCSELRAAAGQRMTAGETIALVGSSGLATGPHLHFELRCDGVYFNPEYYING